MVDIIKGEPNVRARVKMTNVHGAETTTYDVAGGVQWTSSDESVAGAVDDDADPRDTVVEIRKVGQATLSVSFDGDPGEGVRTVSGTSEVINAIDGEATGAEIFIEFAAT